MSTKPISWVAVWREGSETPKWQKGPRTNLPPFPLHTSAPTRPHPALLRPTKKGRSFSSQTKKQAYLKQPLESSPLPICTVRRYGPFPRGGLRNASTQRGGAPRCRPTSSSWRSSAGTAMPAVSPGPPTPPCPTRTTGARTGQTGRPGALSLIYFRGPLGCTRGVYPSSFQRGINAPPPRGTARRRSARAAAPRRSLEDPADKGARANLASRHPAAPPHPNWPQGRSRGSGRRDGGLPPRRLSRRSTPPLSRSGRVPAGPRSRLSRRGSPARVGGAPGAGAPDRAAPPALSPRPSPCPSAAVPLRAAPMLPLIQPLRRRTRRLSRARAFYRSAECRDAPSPPPSPPPPRTFAPAPRARPRASREVWAAPPPRPRTGLEAEPCLPGCGYCGHNVCAFVLCPPRALALEGVQRGMAGVELQLLEINSACKHHESIESLRYAKASKIT